MDDSPRRPRRAARRPDRPPRRHDHLALGRHGEDLVVAWYAQRGLVVLARNWRCAQGELDIVLRDGPVLVCCEVETRSSARFGSPLEAVDRRRVGRLRAAATAFLRAERPGGIDEVRFDVAAVVGNRVQVVPAAF
jgi:putative endonuclease